QGLTVNFNATAVGPGTITYQWKLNGAVGNLSGQTSPTLTVSNVQQGNAGNYTLTATNSNGSTTSSQAMLTVIDSALPIFTTQPQAQTVVAGSTVTFTAVAANAITYQWFKNGTMINGA